MKKQILENDDITANSRQIALLKKHFPNCFDKDGHYLPEKMVEIVQSEQVNISYEGYSLNWLGKSYARLLANLHTETLLAANTSHNAKPENKISENLLIQGDNLDVLKHLKNAYAEKIKMIYIDPPYNTGSDGFVYQDDRKFTVEQLSELIGIDEDEAKRILEFTASKSNSHSAWLTFMYPRLYIARELLREDGVIFISIDDNEQAQLKMLCDEIFGEENFVASIPCRKRTAKSDVPYGVSQDFDVILSWAKSDTLLGTAHNRKYHKSSDFPDDRWRLADLTKQTTQDERKNSAFDMINPKNGEIYPFNPNRTWSITKDTFPEYYAAGKIVFPGDYSFLNIKIPSFRVFESEDIAKALKKYNSPKPIKAVSTLLPNNIALTKDGNDEIVDLFGQKLFSYSKPPKLIEFLAKITNDIDGVFLDFFAGSGTTAHAVMALNAEDDGNRKYIAVQLDEKTDRKDKSTSAAYKAGYKSIFDITRERILRAAQKIQEENPDAKCDFGFREYKTVNVLDLPNFKGYLSEADTVEQFQLFQGDKLTDEERAQLLLTWQVYDGLPLNLDLTAIDLNGYTAYQGKHILYCIASNLSLDHIIAMLEKLDKSQDFAPQKIVIFEYILSDKSKREIIEAIKGYNNHKNIELHLEIRA